MNPFALIPIVFVVLCIGFSVYFHNKYTNSLLRASSYSALSSSVVFIAFLVVFPYVLSQFMYVKVVPSSPSLVLSILISVSALLAASFVLSLGIGYLLRLGTNKRHQ
jgi:Na+/H+ antiporter NhaC